MFDGLYDALRACIRDASDEHKSTLLTRMAECECDSDAEWEPDALYIWSEIREELT